MSRSRHAQAGITLIITLMMLVMFTLFAVAAIRLANVNLRLVGNYQWQKEMEALTDSAIEQLSSSTAAFSLTPVGQDICSNGTIATIGACASRIGGIGAPVCLSSGIVPGYTKKLGEIPPEITNWEVTATAADAWSGASMTITRGLSIRLLSGNCPE